MQYVAQSCLSDHPDKDMHSGISSFKLYNTLISLGNLLKMDSAKLFSQRQRKINSKMVSISQNDMS